jgi:MerR family transcriptional regulator, heat shock protein HspR
MTTTTGEPTPGQSSTGGAFRAVAEDAPVFVISVAAELAGMHAQTLRQYDRLGLVRPGRTPGGGRRYSPRDVALLREVQRLSQEDGVNLAGIKRIIDLESQVEALQERVRELLAALESAESRLVAAETAARAGYGGDTRYGTGAGYANELVPLRPPTSALVVWRPREQR